MKGSLILVLLFYIISFSYAQTGPKKGMAYDKENSMYYRISNDDKHLYLSFYKDEYAAKVIKPGGIMIFFNTVGKKDTLNVPSILFPVYSYPNRDFEIVLARGFTGVPSSKISIYNKYGITAEAKYKEISTKSEYAKDYSIFDGKISIPLKLLKSSGTKLCIMVLLRGVRLKPLPVGANLGVLMNTTPEQNSYFSNIDYWTHSWISYQMK